MPDSRPGKMISGYAGNRLIESLSKLKTGG